MSQMFSVSGIFTVNDSPLQSAIVRGINGTNKLASALGRAASSIVGKFGAMASAARGLADAQEKASGAGLLRRSFSALHQAAHIARTFREAAEAINQFVQGTAKGAQAFEQFARSIPVVGESFAAGVDGMEQLDRAFRKWISRGAFGVDKDKFLVGDALMGAVGNAEKLAEKSREALPGMQELAKQQKLAADFAKKEAAVGAKKGKTDEREQNRIDIARRRLEVEKEFQEEMRKADEAGGRAIVVGMSGSDSRLTDQQKFLDVQSDLKEAAETKKSAKLSDLDSEEKKLNAEIDNARANFRVKVVSGGRVMLREAMAATAEAYKERTANVMELEAEVTAAQQRAAHQGLAAELTMIEAKYTALIAAEGRGSDQQKLLIKQKGLELAEAQKQAADRTRDVEFQTQQLQLQLQGRDLEARLAAIDENARKETEAAQSAEEKAAIARRTELEKRAAREGASGAGRIEGLQDTYRRIAAAAAASPSGALDRMAGPLDRRFRGMPPGTADPAQRTAKATEGAEKAAQKQVDLMGKLVELFQGFMNSPSTARFGR